MKIRYKLHSVRTEMCINKKGDWIDLRSAEDKVLEKGCYTLISLGISMELPEGFEVIIAPRSSTFKTYGFIVPNSFGIIDSSYCGDDDVWRMTCLPFDRAVVKKGDRIAQFRIQPNQFATPWQKIKWLFTKKIEFVEVQHLGNESRGGFGSTGRR